jgi:hypothetical protein
MTKISMLSIIILSIFLSLFSGCDGHCDPNRFVGLKEWNIDWNCNKTDPEKCYHEKQDICAVYDFWDRMARAYAHNGRDQ